MTRSATAQRFRQRKLSTKQNLQVIYGEDAIDHENHQNIQNVAKVESGVERGEETVSVLSVAISQPYKAGK